MSEVAYRVVRVALLLSALPVAGCGTVANLAKQKPGQGGVSPFGGVRHDVWCINKAATGELGLRTHPKSGSEHDSQTALVLLCAADLPLSLIGDIVTWPYTVIYTYINQPPPVPPVTVAPPPPPPVPAESEPQTSPPERLPEPRKLP